MNKRIISAIMAAAVAFSAVPFYSVNPVQDYSVTANAADYTEGTYENLTYKKYSDHIEITGCDESAEKVVIPAEIEGVPVKYIGFAAFFNCRKLTEITIPNSITRISNAFQGCSVLKSITIPDSVEYIETNTFDNCGNLKEINVSENNKYYSSINGVLFSKDFTKLLRFPNGLYVTREPIPDFVTSIGDGAFYYTQSLTEVTIPDSVTSIGSDAFRHCLSLKKVTFSDSVTSIGEHAFVECGNLTTLTIPDSVISIGYGAFSSCSSLTSITILNSDCEIYDDSVTVCNGYNGTFNGTVYGYSGSTAQAYAEKYGYNFEAIDEAPEVDENLKYEKYSDHVEITGCDKSAVSVVIPAEIYGLPVTSIGYEAFGNCDSLTSIVIPNSITSIGCEAFYACFSLTSIVIPDSVISIGNNAFCRCSGLTSITIPDSVTSIGKSAFEGCLGLTSITIPDSVISIGNRAFYSCSSFKEITIPDSVTSIGNGAFYSCSSLKEITIPDSVISIGGGAFYGTPWLEAKQKENPLVIVNNILIDGTICEGDVVIPDSVTSIDDSAFANCSSLTGITIPDGVTSIGYNAFAYCDGLTSITIPDSVTSIGQDAFYGCSGLTSITIPDGVTSIGNNAFYNTPWFMAKQKENPLVVVNSILIDGSTCEGNVIIPDGVTSIGDRVFANCYGLTDITIPDSVKSIGGSAFFGTPWLEAKQKENPLVVVNNILIDGKTCEGDVVIPDSVTNISDFAFNSCYFLTSITIPDSIISIGAGTFTYCSNLKSITVLNPDCKIYDDSYTICNGHSGGLDGDNWESYFKGTIRGYSGSTAQEYAEKYGYNFESLGEIENPETLLGDANCDGEISVADATLVLQYCGNKDKYKLTEQGLINADVDGTAGISAVDALRIQQYDAGVIEKF